MAAFVDEMDHDHQDGEFTNPSDRMSRMSNISTNSLFAKAAISQRIVNVEHYMAFPIKEFDNVYSDFRSSSVKRVPVIRIFGPTSAGQKMCANIHGVYPYISILDDGSMENLEYRVASALDNAINDSVNTSFNKDSLAHINTQHVFKVLRVSGRTFYGYRSTKEVFLRIFFYNPMMVKKAIDLLQSGSILGRRFQPYESHIPCTLQFMIDYSLYGMNFIHYAAAKFRLNDKRRTEPSVDGLLPSSQVSNVSNSSISSFIDPDSIPEGMLGPRQLTKSTLCELEVDIIASDILMDVNSSENCMSVNPGIDCIWKDEIERRRQQGLENCSQITIPASQERSQAELVHSTEDKYQQILWGKIQTYFDDQSILNTGSQELSFLETSQQSQSLQLGNPDAFPSCSQLHDHLSQNRNSPNGNVSKNHDNDNTFSQDEEKFEKLLEEMAANINTEVEYNKIAHIDINGIDGGGLEEEVEEEDSFNEDSNIANDNVWNDSFLSCSMLEKISDIERSFEEEERKKIETSRETSNGTPIIFQCDGQVNDSDSSDSDVKPVARATRRSTKATTNHLGATSSSSQPLKSKEKAKITKNNDKSQSKTKTQSASEDPTNSSVKGSSQRKSSRVSSSSISPANRLSLKMRRKSRSQQESNKAPCNAESLDSASGTTSRDNGRSARKLSPQKTSPVKPYLKSTKARGRPSLTMAEKPKLPIVKKTIVRKSTSNESPLSLPIQVNSSSASRIVKDVNDLNRTPNKKPVRQSPSSTAKSPRTSEQKRLLENKEVIICLTKVDLKHQEIPETTTKRQRRKPKRFMDDDTTQNLSSQSSTSTSVRVSLDSTSQGSATNDKVKVEIVEEIEKKSNSIIASTQESDETDFYETPEKAASTHREKVRQIKHKSAVLKSVKTEEAKPPIKQEVHSEELPNKQEILRIESQSKSIAEQNRKSVNKSNTIQKLPIQKKTRLGMRVTPKGSVAGMKFFPKRETTPNMALPSELSVPKIDPRVDNNNSQNNNKGISDLKTKMIEIELKKESCSSSENYEPIVSSPQPSEPKQYLDTGILCKPSVTTEGSQTNPPVSLKEAAVQVQQQVVNKSSQHALITHNEESQTSTIKTQSVSTQTDIIESLCLCQCTCVRKEKADVGIESQAEFQPIMESKRIQVDNGDLITRVRQGRFTTPQGNKIKHSTPSRSPEKRKTLTDSPKRRGIMPSGMLNMSHSRYLSALVMKTPTSTHKHHRSSSLFRENVSTPTDTVTTEDEMKKTPPSKEEYLINILRSSVSPRNARRHSSHIKPRNLLVETSVHEDEADQGLEEKKNVDEAPAVLEGGNRNINETLSSFIQFTISNSTEINGNDELTAEPKVVINGTNIHSQQDRPNFVDLSINSVYEYEDDNETPPELMPEVTVSPYPPLPLPSTPQNQSLLFIESSQNGQVNGQIEESPALTPNSEDSQLSELFQSPNIEELTPISAFQKKRILSKNRSRIRLERRKAASLDANREIPDIFKYEFEPLKQPPSYKSMAKWLEAEWHRNPTGKIFQRSEIGDQNSPDVNVVESMNNNSSDEELPAPVKLFGGGCQECVSDEEDSDEDNGSCAVTISRNENRNPIKAFTPPLEIDDVKQTSNNTTPRSILRQKKTFSRRQSGLILKRKIRWDDDEDSQGNGSQKRLKLDNGCEDDSIFLSNESILNQTADVSELDGPAMKNALGLDNSVSNFHDVKALHQCQFITSMCVEVHCASRDGLTPDPAQDPILAIFILISSDYPDNYIKPKECTNILLFEETENINHVSSSRSQSMKAFSDEIEMIEAFIAIVRYWDPDMLVGYEVEKFSFGYIIQRGFHLGKDMAQELSRVIPYPRKARDNKVNFKRNNEEWNGTIRGRIVLNVWRLLRHEITVNSYTFENAAYHILRRRVYKFSFRTLANYWKQKIDRIKVIQYYSIRIKGVLQMMEKLDLINRTSELARLFGIQFYEVLSRGSQFRVESMMLRATKSQDFVAPSPTVMQRAKMRAPEFLPLILEPQSNYYTDPVAVLDFQSLYPSMMIAYNYDYASLIGRVEHLGSLDRFPVGCLDHFISPDELLRLKEHIHVSPAGVAFLDKSIVKGVVPEMLEQILDTRQMVKRAMKRWKNEGASLHKVLDSRQLGLKLIANVTYGYTSANFSGRMPCIEIADSIVSKGRETLQRAIDHVKANFHRWGGEVVYGDTDSLFVLFRGKSKDEAFKLGYEIAEEVTQANPKPVKLKFEKIYQPCILQTKKRYVGYSYETPDQQKPTYDAKGIETVRRDGCPAVRKILEKTLHTLFTTNKPSRVEEYVKFQFEKLFKGRVSMQDYLFARKFRGRSGYKPKASVPALEIAKKLTEADPRAEPLTAERVPYVVIYGDPNLPLIKLVRRPDEFLDDPSMRLNAHYYIEKVIIPALNRCLKLAKMDASKWYLQMPRKYLRNILEQRPGGQRTLDNYMLHKNCLRCDGRAEQGNICPKCLQDETGTTIYLQGILKNSKLKLSSSVEICTNCSGETNQCISLDCPILHKFTRYKRDQVQMKNIERELMSLEW